VQDDPRTLPANEQRGAPLSSSKLTLLDLFKRQVQLASHRPALRQKRSSKWVTTTWGEWSERSTAFAASLIHAGLSPQSRVAIIANTCQAWVESDIAILLAGGVTVPVYDSLPGEQIRYILANSNAEIVLVENPLLVETLLLEQEHLPHVRLIVSFERRALRPEPDANGRRMLDLADVQHESSLVVRGFEDCISEGKSLLTPEMHQELDRRAAAIHPDDMASIMYTSGTVGPPKGAMLSHGNFVFEMDALALQMNLGAHDEQLLFLPLAHILGRILEFAQLRVGFVTSFAENTQKILEDAIEINPSFFASVPRLFEKFYDRVRERTASTGKLKSSLVARSMSLATEVSKRKRSGQPVPKVMALQVRLAEKLLYKQLREQFGTRLRFALSGGAPLSAELAHWFDGIGILILEGYGLTETTSATHVATPSSVSFGSVGPSIPGIDVKLGEDGEILVKGGNVMMGYWQNAEATAEVFTPDGFFRTGDIGEIDPHGILKITGRKKDIIVTAAGKNISPQNLEKLLTASDWIQHAVVAGDNRPYLVAVVSLDPTKLARWQRDLHQQDSDEDAEELDPDKKLQQIIQFEIDRVNQRLARFEMIRKFSILPEPFSVEHGELTPTQKVKRRYIIQRYDDLFASMYAVVPAKTPTLPRTLRTPPFAKFARWLHGF
jgi:long-chain acyl-CoA synthetase